MSAFATAAPAQAAPLNGHFGVPDFAPIDALAGTDLSLGISSREAGCQVKGLGGFTAALPAGGAPGLNAGTTYLYTIKPTGQAAPLLSVCMPIAVSVPSAAPAAGTSNLGFLQWEQTPGATNYEIYRGVVGLQTKDTLQRIATVPAAAVCPAANPVANDGTNGGTYHARRCNFTDLNTAAPGPAIGPLYPPVQTQAGSHPAFKMVQRMDYGGPDNTPLSELSAVNGNEPFTCGNPGSLANCATNPATNEAIKTDLFHFPDGLVANPRATRDAGGNVAFCARTGPNSLLGSETKFGSQDPDEDTCPLNTKVGTVQTITRVPNPASPGNTRLSISFGDIYNAAPEGTEAGRLFVVIRPACSAGHPAPFNPSGAVCQALVPNNPAGNDAGREVEKEFQAAVANIVPTPGANGQYHIDTNVVDERTGGDIENFQQVLTHTTFNDNTSAFQEGPVRIPRQVRVIQQELWGFGSTATTTGDNPSHDNPALDTPFMTLPTSCQQNRMVADKTDWETPTQSSTTPATEGLFLTQNCQNVPFQPTLVSEVDTDQAEAPVANSTAIVICQDPANQGDNCPANPDVPIHQAHVKNVRAVFPEGLVVNASAGNFIKSVGVKIGDVAGFADELGELGGDIKLKQVNPDNTFVIEAEVRPKDTPAQVIPIEFKVTPNKQTGQLTAEADNTPQLPFKELQLRLGGQGIPKTLVNPPTNGDNVTHVELTPWCTVVTAPAAGAACDESLNPANPWGVDDKFVTTGGVPQGGPDNRPFSPKITGSMDPATANQDGNLHLTLKKDDRQQNFKSFGTKLPDGLLANLGALNMCPADKADTADCSEANRIGTATISAGNGPEADLLKLSGPVYITQPLVEGDIAGMVVKIVADVGPFHLGNVITKSRVKLDTSRFGVDVETLGAFPTILDGFPVRIRSIDLDINGLRNPVDCGARQFSATFASEGDPTTNATKADTGATASDSSPFNATGCDTLAFGPKIAANIGSASEPAAVDSHPPVSTIVTQPDHEAAISKSVVTLPQGLNPNVAALGTLCSADQLSANSCPAASKVGSAKAFSPLLVDPLAGPVYLVENPGGLPKLVIRLGGLFALDLTGNTALQGGRLVTTLSGLPATPVSRFELNIDGGSKGLFTVSDSLCTATRTIDAAFDSHSGQHATDSRAVSTVGCAASSKASKRPTLSVRVSRLGKTPIMTIRARRGSSSSNRLSTMRVTIPKRFAVVAKKLKKGIHATAGGKRLTSKQFSLSRSGVLTVKGLPKFGRSDITVTIRGGAIRAGKSLRGLAVKKRTLPRIAFIGRLVDVKNQRYNYTVRVRPTR